MYVMRHGEERINGVGLTKEGINQVKKAIWEIKKSQDPDNCREHYIADIVTSDSKCCTQTAEIAAKILNIDIEKSPFCVEKVKKGYSIDEIKVNVIVSNLLRGIQPNENITAFYKRVKELLSEPTIKNLENSYFSSQEISVPSPLLLHDDGYWRTHLVVVDQSMINAIYRYFYLPNEQVRKLAEKLFFAQNYASIFIMNNFKEDYYDRKADVTYTLRNGNIRKADYTDF